MSTPTNSRPLCRLTSFHWKKRVFKHRYATCISSNLHEKVVSSLNEVGKFEEALEAPGKWGIRKGPRSRRDHWKRLVAWFDTDLITLLSSKVIWPDFLLQRFGRVSQVDAAEGQASAYTANLFNEGRVWWSKSHAFWIPFSFEPFRKTRKLDNAPDRFLPLDRSFPKGNLESGYSA